MLSYLKVAEHMTGDAKYRAAYQKLVREGHYDINVMVPKIATGPGLGKPVRRRDGVHELLHAAPLREGPGAAAAVRLLAGQLLGHRAAWR